MEALVIFISVILALILIFLGVWCLWMHETNPKTKHKPPDPDYLKCNKNYNNRYYT